MEGNENLKELEYAKKYRIGAIIGAPYMSTSTATELSFSCASFSADSIFPRLSERVRRNQEDREKVEEFGKKKINKQKLKISERGEKDKSNPWVI